jgi:uncharacterized protein (UPF0212 family)
MRSPALTRLDPELTYLILLTKTGLKPLSRWEKGLDSDSLRAIRSEGLLVDTVERRTRLGRRLHETVFARKSRYVDLYGKRYHGTRLRDTPDDARLQGRLFGYPSCCVEAFVDRPYTPNELDPSDQEILFHWACPTCNTTPGLVREYRRVNTIWGNGGNTARGSRGRPRTWTGGAVGKVAASLALAAGTMALATPAIDPHWLLLHDDLDQDGLAPAEEILAGVNWHKDDTDGDQVRDGEQLGAVLLQLINTPVWPWINVHEYPMCGLAMCTSCGEWVNMGYIVVENTMNGLSVQLKYMGLHAMENGCLSYSYRIDGAVGDSFGQVDLDLLKRVLEPHLTYPHAIPPRADDTDGDGLTDDEETRLGTNPASGNDGFELAQALLPLVAELPRSVQHHQPYLIEYEMDGVEQCEICGETFNMGFVEVVNPLEEISLSMPYIGLHMLAHGGFAYDGTTNDGEVLPLVLQTVLTADGSAHWVTIPADTDDDGLLDSEEAFFGLDPATADEDGTERPDGRELAVRMAAKVTSLPEGPLPGETYVVHHMTHGHYDCLVCGEPVNMGLMEVVDPVAAKTTDVPYYSHHFMEHGSFSTDRDDLYPRVDPTLVGDVIGITSITGVEGGAPAVAFSFVTAPNPFGPEGGAQISLTVPANGQVEVTVYDVQGRRVRELYAGETTEKSLSLRWDGTDDDGRTVGAGIYFCRARFGQVVVSRKMTLVR